MGLKESEIMRVLFLSNYFCKLPNLTSFGTWALDQAEAISNDNEVFVISFTPFIPKIMAFNNKMKLWSSVYDTLNFNSNLKIYYPRINPYIFKKIKDWSISRPDFLSKILLKKIKKTAIEFNPDMIIASHVLIEGLMAYNIKKDLNINYICFEHSPDDFIPRNKNHKDIYKKIVDNSANFINVSQYSFDKIDVYYNFNKNINKVLYNYSKDAKYYIDEKELKNLGFYDKKKKYIIEVGNYEKRKNHMELLKIFNDIKDRYTTWNLVFVGGAHSTLNEIYEYIQKNNLSERVFVFVDLKHDEVLNLLNFMDIFCLPSFEEMFSVSALEALSAEIPTVVTRFNGLTDKIFNDSSIINIDPYGREKIKNVIVNLIEDKSLRDKLGHDNRCLFEKYFCQKVYENNINKILKDSLNANIF